MNRTNATKLTTNQPTHLLNNKEYYLCANLRVYVWNSKDLFPHARAYAIAGSAIVGVRYVLAQTSCKLGFKWLRPELSPKEFQTDF